MEKERSKPQSKRPLLIACSISCVLVVLFGWMQTQKAPFLELKAQWLSVAMVPILVVLIAGNYIISLKAFGMEAKFRPNAPFRGLPRVDPPTLTLAMMEQAEWAISENEPRPTWFLEGRPEWTKDRENEYQRVDGLFLVHVYEPSKQPEMKYDITIFLIRHTVGPKANQREAFIEIEKMELYLGPSWGHQVFTFHNNGGLIGIRTSAWGTFLAIARITFKDEERLPVILHRYIDFEMAPKHI
jgi:hypothetical protein